MAEQFDDTGMVTVKQHEVVKNPVYERFQLIPFDDIKMPRSPLYRVRGLLPEQGTGIVWGAYAEFKSFWLFDLSMHVALGWDYRGRPVKQGPVVHCYFEAQDNFAKRKEAFVQAHMKDEELSVPFYLQVITLDLINDHQLLISDIRSQCPNPAVVNFDTMARSLVGDENSTLNMGEYFRAADAIRQAFKCTVIIVHHSGYQKKHPRGSTALPSNSDFEIKIEKAPDQLVIATIEKLKDEKAGDQIFSVWQQIKIGEEEDGCPITSCVLRETDFTKPSKS